MSRLAARFLGDQGAATSIEYAIVASGISIVILAAVNGIGTSVRDSFILVNTSLK